MRPTSVTLCVLLVASTAVAQVCVPHCRTGFVCVAGQCVSKCNPVCGAGERCTAAGECEPVAQPPPAPAGGYAMPPRAPAESYAMPPAAPVDAYGQPLEVSGVSAVRELPGWALGGAILGFVSAGAVGLLSVGSAMTNGESTLPSLPLGAAATLVFGVTVPLVAGAAASARSGTGVNGSVGLRVTGWVLYGLTLANAVVAVVLGVTTYVPTPIIYSLGALGMLTEVMMSIDALVSRAQASEVVERNQRAGAGVKVLPYFSVAPTPQRAGAMAMFGVGGRF